MMITVFTATVQKDDTTNGTGIPVPEDAIDALASGKKPKIKVTLHGYTYRTTIAVMRGIFYIPLSADHRAAAGVKAGDTVNVSLELDTEPRIVEVPSDLAAALSQKPGLREAFDVLAYSIRKEYVHQVESAKARETRDRRIDKIVSNLGG